MDEKKEEKYTSEDFEVAKHVVKNFNATHAGDASSTGPIEKKSFNLSLKIITWFKTKSK